MNEITMNQANEIMDVICIAICYGVGRTISLTSGEKSTVEYLTPEIQEKTRECFCNICDILGIEEVLEN